MVTSNYATAAQPLITQNVTRRIKFFLKPRQNPLYISQSSKIYPNPVLDQINVMVGGTNNKVKLLLFNINGVLLEEKEILFDKYQRDFIFNMDNYPRGMYLISVQSEGKIENFKFLKL